MNIILELLNNATLLISLAMLHSFLLRQVAYDSHIRILCSGLLFGTAAVLGMSLSVEMIPGVVFDGRSLVLSMAGLFGGPVVAGMAAIMVAIYRTYLMTQSKTGVSAMTPLRFLGVTTNTAWLVKHKLTQTMKERDERLPLERHVQVDGAGLGGQTHDSSKGRGATGKSPIVAAVQCNLAGDPVRMRLSVLMGFRRRELKWWAERHIKPGSVAITDGLSCFRGIADAGSHHRPIVTGSGHRAAQDPRFWAINTMLGNAKSALTGTCRAPSIGHAPWYLAEFCYRFNRRFRLGEMLVRLANAAIATPPLLYPLAILAEHHGYSGTRLNINAACYS